MRCFLSLAANALLSALAGFGIAESASAYDFPPLIYVGVALIGGCLAGGAICHAVDVVGDKGKIIVGLPKVVGLIGTLTVCAAVLIGHLSPPELKSVAIGVWILGLVFQAASLAMVAADRRTPIVSPMKVQSDRQKPRGA
jgi:hypothetical protein